MHNLDRLVRMTLTVALIPVVLLACSILVPAQTPFTGELLVAGPGVTINGEPASNGRTIVAPSTITTAAGSYATLNFGKIGKLQMSPGTTFTIDGSGQFLRGSLSTGSVTVIAAANPVPITLICGKTVIANAGDIVSVDTACGPSPQLPKMASKSTSPVLYLLVAGAAVGLIAGIAGGGGGGGTTSPTT